MTSAASGTPSYQVPFGRGTLSFSLPPTWRGTVIESRTAPPIEDVAAEVAAALSRPTGSPRLRDIARPGDRVCIVFTDSTRASPDRSLLEPALEELAEAGIRDGDVTLLCGVGLHRPSTIEEKIEKLGAQIVRRYRVIDHEAQNRAVLVDLGASIDGIPFSVHRAAAEADLLVATGIVEPHQYAGYSGGRKTVAIGAGGEPFIGATHGPAMVDHPGTRLARIEGNPFHEAVAEAARRAGLRFIINAILDDRGRVVAVRAGAPEPAFEALVALARGIYEVPIARQFDGAIAGVGHPKDVNLYQASRAVSYLFFAPVPVVKPGGFYILPAPCDEGAGAGAGEQRFLKLMREAPDARHILEHARAFGYPPGGQRAFIMAKVLQENEVVVVGARDLDLARSAKFGAAATFEEAFRAIASRRPGPLDIAIVPHALLTLPVVQPAR